MNISVYDLLGEDAAALARRLQARGDEADDKVLEAAREILADVKRRGDEAVREYTSRFDGCLPDALEVPRDEWEKALEAADPAFVAALERAASNIRTFHARQKPQGFIDARTDGSMVGQRVVGLKRVGLYVPGGTAAYPSSVLMNAIPAKIAGVKALVAVTPPLKDGRANPDILVAAAIAGVDKLYLMGGAQAIGALAYGTKTIEKVDKIVGPGNAYVAAAKRLVYGQVDIDMIAGPSEIMILADDTADPRLVAADMLSQAEHDRMASAILATTSRALGDAVQAELSRQLEALPRREIAEASLLGYGAIVLCPDTDALVDFAAAVAPEHLEVLLEAPTQYLGRLDNAGSVFLGPYSPEPLGDYYAGPNHVLPTSGTARFFSPLGVETFTKRTSFIAYTKPALEAAKADVVLLAKKEGLDAHANAVSIRFE